MSFALARVEYSMLLRHFLLHVSEHLEELVFVRQWWVGVSGCPREGAKRLFHEGAEIEAARGNDAPMMAMDLPLEVVPLLVVGCFSKPLLFRGFFLERLR